MLCLKMSKNNSVHLKHILKLILQSNFKITIIVVELIYKDYVLSYFGGNVFAN